MLCVEALRLYLSSRIAAGLTRAYVSRVARILNSFLSFTPAALVAELEPVYVSDYLAHRLESCKASTVAGARACILAWLGWLVLEGVVEDRRWGARVARVKQPKPLTAALSPEQARAFLLTAELGMPHRTELARRRDYAMICTLIDSGLRLAELLALRLEDVDLTHCSLRVRHGKGDKERVALFGELTQGALRSYLRVRRRRVPRGGSSLWVTRSGSCPSRSLLLAIVHRIGNACGLSVTVHQLRHTCATQLLRGGMPLPLVARQLGHSQLRSTQRYLHLLDSDLREAYASASPVSRVLG